jgi:hypothetical protein
VPVPSYPGVTISGVSPLIADGPSYGAPSNWLADNAFGGFLDLDFVPPVNAVGFNVAGNFSATASLTVNLRDGAVLVDTQTFTANGLDVFDTFAGFSDLGDLDNMRVSVLSDADFVNVDNLYYGRTSVVPEPSSVALLSLVLAGMGIVRVRRRSQDQASLYSRRSDNPPDRLFLGSIPLSSESNSDPGFSIFEIETVRNRFRTGSQFLALRKRCAFLCPRLARGPRLYR